MTILTTHSSSLPHSQETIDFTFTCEHGKDGDQAAFDVATDDPAGLTWQG